MSAKPRIVLLHATPIAIAPVEQAFAAGWPEAETINLLDDGLTIDRAKEEQLSAELIERFVDFGRYAHRIGADGILATCSAFGPAIDRLIAALPIPVLKPNEAMFRTAISKGKRIGMLATFAPAVSTMQDEFTAFVDDMQSTAQLDVIVVEGANQRLREGDAAAHNSLVAAQAPRFANYDAIMLAHFSTSRAAERVRGAVGITVLTAPESAVARMKQLIEGLER